MSINLVVLKGRLGAAPDRKLHGNGPRTTFQLAVDEYRGKDQPKHTTWVPVVAWGQLADTIAEYFASGDEILVFGAFAEDRWVDGGGRSHANRYVRLRKFEFCGPTRKHPELGKPRAMAPEVDLREWQDAGGGDMPEPHEVAMALTHW